jgi:class 3 adenylate cyclase
MGVVFGTTASLPLVLAIISPAGARRLENTFRRRTVCIRTRRELDSRRSLEFPMCATPVKRKLAAILATDAVGYSKMMSADEEGTMKVLAAHRAVIDGSAQ